MSHHQIVAMEDEVGIYDAILSGDIDIIKAALSSFNGKDIVYDEVNRCDRKGWSPLHLATCRGNKNVVGLLLENGAEANIADHHGNTPLHWCGHADIIELLVSHGANIVSRNHTDATPKMMSLRRGVSQDVIDMFETYENDLIPESEPLLPHSESSVSFSTSTTTCGRAIRKLKDLDSMPSVWYEFCLALGPQRLVLLLLSVLMISLYVAFTVTGLNQHVETKIPVLVDDHTVEL